MSVSTAAIERPQVLQEAAGRVGSQRVLLALDALRVAGSVATRSGFEVMTHGGSHCTGIDAVAWAARGQQLGAGQIMLNSMDADGTRDGYDTEMLQALRAVIDIPLIASGGAGALDHSPRRCAQARTRYWPPASSTSASYTSPRSNRRYAPPARP